MIPAAALLAAVTVAQPADGARLPYLDRCYMIGAVPRGVTNLVVQGKEVEIYRTGAWVTMLDLEEGTNRVEIAADGETTNIVVHVAAKPKPAGKAAAAAPEKKYEKLEYAADAPAPRRSSATSRR